MRKKMGLQFLIILVLLGTNLFTFYHLVDISVRSTYQNDQRKNLDRDREALAKILFEATKGASFSELKALVMQAGMEVPKITKKGEPVIAFGALTSFRFKNDRMIAVNSGDQFQPLAESLD